MTLERQNLGVLRVDVKAQHARSLKCIWTKGASECLEHGMVVNMFQEGSIVLNWLSTRITQEVCIFINWKRRNIKSECAGWKTSMYYSTVLVNYLQEKHTVRIHFQRVTKRLLHSKWQDPMQWNETALKDLQRWGS